MPDLALIAGRWWASKRTGEDDQWSVAMKCWLLSVLLLCITSMVPPRAEAFVEDPYIVPAHPTPETPIWVHVYMGWCHGSLDAVDGAVLQTIAPGQLRLITTGVVLDAGHPFCNDPPFDYRFDIGTLPEGAYTLQFFIRDDLSGAGLVGFGSVSFEVRPPAVIPTTSTASLAILLAVLGMTGALVARCSSRWLFSAMLSCAALLASPMASAYVDDPFITPMRPTPDTPISVHINTGWCNTFWGDVDEGELVVASPGQLRLIAQGVVLPPGHPLCIHPPFTYRFDIGTLPAGSYALQVFIRDDIGGSGTVGFGSVSFTVAPPARVPAASRSALTLLPLLLSTAGAFAVRRS